MLPCGIQSKTGRHGATIGYPEGTLEDVPNNLKNQMLTWYYALDYGIGSLEQPRGQYNGYVKAFLSEAGLSLTLYVRRASTFPCFPVL